PFGHVTDRGPGTWLLTVGRHPGPPWWPLERSTERSLAHPLAPGLRAHAGRQAARIRRRGTLTLAGGRGILYVIGTIHRIPNPSNRLESRRSSDEHQHVTGDGVRPVQPGVPGRPVPGVPLDARRGPGVLQREVELVGSVQVRGRPRGRDRPA